MQNWGEKKSHKNHGLELDHTIFISLSEQIVSFCEKKLLQKRHGSVCYYFQP